jgi:hypothetical protein
MSLSKNVIRSHEVAIEIRKVIEDFLKVEVTKVSRHARKVKSGASQPGAWWTLNISFFKYFRSVGREGAK